MAKSVFVQVIIVFVVFFSVVVVLSFKGRGRLRAFHFSVSFSNFSSRGFEA